MRSPRPTNAARAGRRTAVPVPRQPGREQEVVRPPAPTTREPSTCVSGPPGSAPFAEGATRSTPAPRRRWRSPATGSRLRGRVRRGAQLAARVVQRPVGVDAEVHGRTEAHGRRRARPRPSPTGWPARPRRPRHGTPGRVGRGGRGGRSQRDPPAIGGGAIGAAAPGDPSRSQAPDPRPSPGVRHPICGGTGPVGDTQPVSQATPPPCSRAATRSGPQVRARRPEASGSGARCPWP